jgi:hypothetical protein
MNAPAPTPLMPHDAARRNDPLAQVVLALAKEVWVLRDRQILLEAVLAERGVDVTATLDAYQPKGAVAERLAGERRRFAAEIVATLAPPDEAQ